MSTVREWWAGWWLALCLSVAAPEWSRGDGAGSAVVDATSPQAVKLSRNVTASNRLSVAREALQSAAGNGTDIALLPEGWAVGLTFEECIQAYGAVARLAAMAVGVSFSPCPNVSAFVLLDGAGRPVLRYSKLADSPDHPVAGRGHAVTTLNTTKGSLVVGALLGSDVWFMEPARVLMVLGAELVLLPVSFALPDLPERRLVSVRAVSNAFTVAVATYAGDGGGGSGVAGYCGEGPTPRRHGGVLGFDSHADHCPTQSWNFGGDGVEVVAYSFVPAELRLFRVDVTIMSDVTRRPFSYQPLCYPASSTQHHPAPVPPTEGPKMRVALLQMLPVVNKTDPVGASLSKGAELCRRAKAMGADVALMPEMASVGYTANFPSNGDNEVNSTKVFQWMQFATGLDGSYVRAYRALAQELEMGIGATFLEDLPDSSGDQRPPRNSVVLIDRFGEIVYTYAKVHTVVFSEVEAHTTAGRGFHTGVLSTAAGNVTVGSFICYDREHDESGRLAMLGGAELLLAPTACGLFQLFLDEVMVHAMQNVMAVAMTNYAGPVYNGMSNAYDHLGNQLILTPDGENVFTVDFDIGAVRQARQTPRGQAFTDPPSQPELCHLPKGLGFRPVDPGEGYGHLVRANDAL